MNRRQSLTLLAFEFHWWYLLLSFATIQLHHKVTTFLTSKVFYPLLVKPLWFIHNHKEGHPWSAQRIWVMRLARLERWLPHKSSPKYSQNHQWSSEILFIASVWIFYLSWKWVELLFHTQRNFSEFKHTKFSHKFSEFKNTIFFRCVGTKNNDNQNKHP